MGWRDTIRSADAEPKAPPAQAGGWRSTIQDVTPTGEPSIKQEMHPEITWAERANVKNFGIDPQQSITYLKSKHPDMEFSDTDGQIIMRKPGETSWSVLDPKGFDIADISDVAYDIPAGIVQGAATAAGGLLGGGVGGVAAGAGSGAALEALRQGLGNLTGVAQGANLQDIGVAGTLGGIVPGVLGSGASKAAQAAYLGSKGGLANALKAAVGDIVPKVGKGVAADTAETAAKRTLVNAGEMLPLQMGDTLSSGQKELASELLADRQAPALKQAWTAAFDKFRDTTAAERRSLVKKFDTVERIAVEGIEPFFKQNEMALVDGIEQMRTKASQEIADALDSSGVTIDAQSVAGPLYDLRDAFADTAEEMQTDAARQSLADIEGLIKKYLVSERKVVLPDGTEEIVEEPLSEISARSMLELKAHFSDLAEYAKTGGVKSTEGKNPIAKRVITAIRQVNDNITKSVDDTISEKGKSVLGKWKELKDIEREFLPQLAKEDGFGRMMEKYMRKEAKGWGANFEKMGEKIGFNVKDVADTFNLHRKFNNPSWTPVSGAGTSTSKTIPLHGFGSALGQWVMRSLGAADSAAFLGGAAGGAALNAAASRGATRFMTKTGKSFSRSKAGKALQPLADPFATYAPKAAYPWVNMRSTGGEQ